VCNSGSSIHGQHEYTFSDIDMMSAGSNYSLMPLEHIWRAGFVTYSLRTTITLKGISREPRSLIHNFPSATLPVE